MNKIEISTKVQKSVKSNNNPKCRVVNDIVVVNLGQFKNGNNKYTNAKIVQLSEGGIYCDNDEFYPWHLF